MASLLQVDARPERGRRQFPAGYRRDIEGLRDAGDADPRLRRRPRRGPQRCLRLELGGEGSAALQAAAAEVAGSPTST